ncbi:MAG: hypothetical protein C5B59_21140 [Bacteroidetes bacterium]|nr:MAG: hypothetical protein C5B59_21140 [Bacteroidota bacterium]
MIRINIMHSLIATRIAKFYIFRHQTQTNMKSLKLLFGTFVPFALCFTASSPISSCTKTQTIHDTTTTIRNIHDTTIKNIHDTTIKNIHDTTTLFDLRDGLIAYYNFDGGNLKDSSGNNNNIIFSNATPTSDRFGRPNNAYLFDGSSSYMQVSNSASLNPSVITMFAIVKVNGFYQGPCHGNQIFGKGSPDNINGFYSLRFDDPSIVGASSCSAAADTTKEFFYGSFGDNNPIGAGAGAGNYTFPFIHPGEWYTVAYTYDGLISKLYVNGALLSTASKAVAFTPNPDDLFIGRHDSPIYPYFFNGVIDEIRIYNKVVPDEKIHALTALSKLKNTFSASN